MNLGEHVIVASPIAMTWYRAGVLKKHEISTEIILSQHQEKSVDQDSDEGLDSKYIGVQSIYFKNLECPMDSLRVRQLSSPASLDPESKRIQASNIPNYDNESRKA